MEEKGGRHILGDAKLFFCLFVLSFVHFKVETTAEIKTRETDCTDGYKENMWAEKVLKGIVHPSDLFLLPWNTKAEFLKHC